MKIILLSDIHLSTEKPTGRIDDWESAQWRKMEWVWRYAAEHEAIILQAGDLCDRPRNWIVLIKLISFLRTWNRVVYMVRGQHDMYFHSPDSSSTVQILDKLELVGLVEANPGVLVGSEVSIAGIRWGEVEKINRPVAKQKTNILVIHAPIAEAPVFEKHDYIDARSFAEKHQEYDLILCGDIHRHFCIKTKWNTLLNTGPMIRRDVGEYNFRHEPCFYIYDTTTKELTKQIIPHEPAEKVLSRQHLDGQQEIKSLLSDFVEKVKQTLSKESPGVDVMANFRRAIATVDIPQSTKALIMEVVNDQNGK